MNKLSRISCLCLSLLLVASLTACDGPTDEQNSEQPTASTQPTAAPTPTPTPPPIPYTDVAEDSTYYDAVVWAFKNGIATDGETFEPASPCTRGQVMTFLWRAMGSPEPQGTESPFNDVSSADWFYKPALWAYENGVASGTAFNPGNPCTNAEALTFLWRAEGKPAVSVYNSAVALAASGQYYARPAAWAETNGLFAGADFDPATPCSRADLMMYLHWAAEEWIFAEEDKTLQTEYEYILNRASPYSAYGSCLCSADYIDVDGDGTLELLTIGNDGWNERDNRTVIVAVYGSVDGHAQKTCEQKFFTYRGDDFSLCQMNGQLYLCQNVFSGNLGETYDYYKIEKNAVTYCEQASFMWREGTSDQDVAIREKYTNQISLLTISSDDVPAVVDRGIAPDWSWEEQDAYWEEHEEYWATYWTNRWASVPMYAAVLNGDFSAFAGSYADQWGGTLALDKNGMVAGSGYDIAANQKPVSIEITASGAIYCVIIPEGVEWGYDEEYGGEWSLWHGDAYAICPAGVEYEPDRKSVV